MDHLSTVSCSIKTRGTTGLKTCCQTEEHHLDYIFLLGNHLLLHHWWGYLYHSFCLMGWARGILIGHKEPRMNDWNNQFVTESGIFFHGSFSFSMFFCVKDWSDLYGSCGPMKIWSASLTKPETHDNLHGLVKPNFSFWPMSFKVGELDFSEERITYIVLVVWCRFPVRSLYWRHSPQNTCNPACGRRAPVHVSGY